jgi:RNA polymerase sigma-70 factor (ECF subfamily)
MNALKLSNPVVTRSARQRAHQKWFGSSSQLIGKLFVAHRARVKAMLLRNGVAPHEVDDVCSEVFLVALKRASSFQGASSPSTWLCGIARKVAADHRRSARVRYEAPCAELPEGATLNASPCEELERRREHVAVREAVELLKAGPRDVVREFVLKERPMDEVAKALKVPLQTAYARLYAGHAALRVALS